MKKFLALAIVALFSISAFATVPSNNATSWFNYANGIDISNPSGSSNGQWWALPGQPSKTFHRISVKDSSGCPIYIGHGTSPSQVADLIVGGSGVTDLNPVVYPMGLSYGGSATCIWWKRVSSACEPTSGDQIVNFIY
jgi:hypothetical protein